MFDGWCAARGVDPSELPPDRMLNLVYYWLVKDRDEAKRADLDRQLDQPPPGETAHDGAWSAAAEMDAFAQAAAASSAVG